MHTELPAPNPAPHLPTDRRALLAGIGGLAAGAILAGKASAGPLTPPPGPIAPTPGPEPRIPIGPATTPATATATFRITQPGSYYLTENVTGQSGRHGIEISVDGVTIDLMGFALIGVVNSLDGIRTSNAGYRNIIIRNGFVRSWPRKGINLATFKVDGGRVDGVFATDNTEFGFHLGDGCTTVDCVAVGNSLGILSLEASTVVHCTAKDNSGTGIRAVSGTIIGCTASGNGSNGIESTSSCTMTGCTALSNGNNGITAASGCTISNCTSRSNAVHGIQMSSDNLARNNTSDSNGSSGTGAGIRITGNDNRVEDNNCIDNRIGIDGAGSSNFISRNTCSNNVLNWSISANNACFVVNATLSAAFSGNSGGISPGSTNPNANYSY